MFFENKFYLALGDRYLIALNVIYYVDIAKRRSDISLIFFFYIPQRMIYYVDYCTMLVS